MPKLPGDHLFDPERAFTVTTVQAAKHHVCTLHKTVLSVRYSSDRVENNN